MAKSEDKGLNDRLIESLMGQIAEASGTPLGDLTNQGVRVEPTSDQRGVALGMRQQYQAYIDSGFNSREALMFATIPIREAIRFSLEMEYEEGKGRA